jgi:hypothetical protein
VKRLGPHPDDVLGVLAGLGQRLAPRPYNTIPDLAVYEGRTLEELFPAPTQLPYVQVRRRWRLLGAVSEDVWFPSLHQPLELGFEERYRARYDRSHTVWARHVKPPGSEGRPRLLYLHGFMQPETPIEELGLVATLAWRLGVEILQVQPPYHGRRKPRFALLHGDRYWTADLVRSIESLRQSLLDARTALTWLLEQDARPVGVAGLSLGGTLAAALTCLEERFAYSIPMIAHMDLGATLADAPVLETMRRELRRFGWEPEEFGRFMDRIGWNGMLPLLPPERILLLAAADDRFFRPELVRDLWRRWGEPRIEWYPTSHIGFVTRLPRASAVMREFVDGIASRDSAGATDV